MMFDRTANRALPLGVCWFRNQATLKLNSEYLQIGHEAVVERKKGSVLLGEACDFWFWQKEQPHVVDVVGYLVEDDVLES